jgi:hypothetical protein
LTSNFPCAISFGGEEKRNGRKREDLEMKEKQAASHIMRERNFFSLNNFRSDQVCIPLLKLIPLS